MTVNASKCARIFIGFSTAIATGQLLKSSAKVETAVVAEPCPGWRLPKRKCIVILAAH
jgi:hypothetical protein